MGANGVAMVSAIAWNSPFELSRASLPTSAHRSPMLRAGTENDVARLLEETNASAVAGSRSRRWSAGN
jgi:hypothetical protein